MRFGPSIGIRLTKTYFDFLSRHGPSIGIRLTKTYFDFLPRQGVLPANRFFAMKTTAHFDVLLDAEYAAQRLNFIARKR